MNNIRKLFKAVNIIKPNVEFTYSGQDMISENDFNKIIWNTGVENEQAITTTTNPHSELTWTKVKEEMDKL